jgi:ABC-type transporter Mla subunit MlaD
MVLVLGVFRGETITVNVFVDAVSNMRTGSVVYVGGYRVGEITGIEPVFEPRLLFKLNLGIDADFPLYEGTRAQIVAPGVIGDAVVNLLIPGNNGVRLGDGAVIAQAPSIGLTEIASRADSLARSVEQLAARASELLSPEIAGALIGDIRRTLSTTSQSLSTVEGRLIALSDSLMYGMRVATNSMKLVADVLEENRSRVAGTLDSTFVLISEMRGAMRTTGDFVNSERPRIESSLKDLEAILGEMRTLTEDMNQYSLWQMLFKRRHDEPPPETP